MQRALVVGGAGLVGSHLVDRLIALGDEVIAIDDLSRGSFANVAHLKRDKRFVFLEHDVAAPFRAEVDRIFHLAVPSTRMACEPDPVAATRTCATGTMNVLEVATANAARVVLAMSTDRWGEGVRCAESLSLDYGKTRGADVRIVRLPSSYGPRMALDGDHVVTSLILQALRGPRIAAPMPLGRMLRLAYVDEAVETLLRTMTTEEHPRAPVTAPSSAISVVDLAHLIAECAGLADVDVSDGPPSLPLSVRPTLVDALPSSAAFVAEPTVDLAEGLGRTVRWFAGRMSRRPEDRPSGVFARDFTPEVRAG